MPLQVNPKQIAGIALALLAAFVLPLVIGGQWTGIFTSTACFAMAAMGAGFMYSRLGMVSLAQVALMGVGGWVTLRLNRAFAMPCEANLILAAVVTSVLGMLLAIPALRMRGLFLALVTLMVAGGLEVVFTAYQFPNGGAGFWVWAHPLPPKCAALRWRNRTPPI